MPRKGAFAVAAVAVFLLLGPVPVHATTQVGHSVNPSDEEHFRDVWDQYGVSPSTQTKLLAALRNGDLWDALGGHEPANTRVAESRTFIETVSTYADGSISILRHDKLLAPAKAGGIEPMADVSGCVLVSQGPYVNHRRCNVHTNVVVVDFAYNVYFDSVLKGFDKITSVGALSFHCYGGTCSSAKTLIVRPKETASLAALAEGSLVFTCYGGTCSRRYWLDFFVRRDGFSASNN